MYTFYNGHVGKRVDARPRACRACGGCWGRLFVGDIVDGSLFDKSRGQIYMLLACRQVVRDQRRAPLSSTRVGMRIMTLWTRCWRLINTVDMLDDSHGRARYHLCKGHGAAVSRAKGGRRLAGPDERCFAIKRLNCCPSNACKLTIGFRELGCARSRLVRYLSTLPALP